MRTGRPWVILALAALGALPAAPLRGQASVQVSFLYTVESVFAADFSPYNVGQQPDFLSILIQNGGVRQQQVKLRLTIRRERPSTALLFEGTTKFFTLREPLLRLTNRDLSDERHEAVIEQYELPDEGEQLRQLVLETGRFPSGTYVFQVQVIGTNGAVMSTDDERADLVNPTRTELISPGRPFGDTPEVVTGTPRFQWTSDEGLGAGGTYRLRVVPASASASAEEAMQGFASWEHETNATTALYPGSVGAIALAPGGTYAWQVTRIVRTSGGDISIESPIYWFRMGGGAGTQGNNNTGTGTGTGTSNRSGPSEQLGTVGGLNELARALGLQDVLQNLRPTGVLIVDGKPVSAAGLEALLNAILSGQLTIHNVTVR